MKTVRKHVKKGERDINLSFDTTRSYIQYKAAEWTRRLLRREIISLSHNFFQFFYWLSDDLRSVLHGTVEIIKNVDLNGKDEEIIEEISNALDELQQAQKWSSDKLVRDFDDLVRENPCIVGILNECLINACTAIMQNAAKSSEVYTRARKDIKKFFALTPAALKLCEFVHCVQTNAPLEEYFEDVLEIWDSNHRDALACILNIELMEAESALSELASCGLIDRRRDYLRLNSMVLPLWNALGDRHTDRFFCAPLEGDVLPLEKFRISDGDLQHVKALLASQNDTPVHILLYGPPGTGKTTFARSLAQSLKLSAWGVNSRENDDDGDRRTALIACLNIARKKKGGFVLVDESERMLDTSWHGGGREKDKAWLNSLLETNGNHVVWIANHVGHIDPAVLRRFSFSIRFKTLNEQERQDMWKDIIKRHGASKGFTETHIKSLARQYPVSAAVMEQAISQAKALGYSWDEFYQAVERSLRAYSDLVRDAGQKRPDNAKTDIIQDFALDGITIEDSLSDLMERCRRADAAMRDTTRILPRGCASLLFYGPPGTGKTALARHIAHELNRKCIVQRASDLLNCYVGDTEKQIASAFAKAEAEGAVLVIDEADSFLFSRNTAQRSWEVSMVNEFLTNLEDCRSFCICTTNRLEDMDAAAIRRFAYKVSFSYAGPEQIMTLYNALLAPMCGVKLTPSQEAELMSFKYLTPGDFHTVQSQHSSFFSNDGVTEHATLIAALRKEEALKAKFLSRTAGF